jgi:hypothetical protein
MKRQLQVTKNGFVFEKIPIDVFYVVREFLLPTEFRRLLHANHHQFDELRKSANYYNLSCYYSLQFYKDSEFRQSLLSKIPRNYYQISLHLVGTHWDLFPIVNTRYFNKLYRLKLSSVIISYAHLELIQDVQILELSNIRWEASRDIPPAFTDVYSSLPRFKHVKKLILHDFPYLNNVSNLSNLPSISFSLCRELIDITPLIHCEELSFNDCSNLISIQCLGKYQKKISIINCPITEVNHLYEVPTLYFENCGSIENIMNLDSVHSLTIKECYRITSLPNFTSKQANNIYKEDRKKKLFLYNMLKVVPSFSTPEQHWEYFDSIYLGKCGNIHSNIPLHLLAGVREIYLDSCVSVQSVEALGNVPKLILSSLERLKRIEGLGGPQQQHVVIANCPLVEDFSSLQSIKKVEIFSCRHFKSISCVKNVQVLKLKMLPGLTSLVEFRGSEQLQSISLAMCNNVVSLSGLERVGVVEVADCNKLSDVSSLGKNGSQRLSLYGCGKVERVSHLNGLKELKIQNCPNIKDLGSFDNEKNNLVLLRANHSDPVVVVPKPSLWKQFKKAVTKPFH